MKFTKGQRVRGVVHPDSDETLKSATNSVPIIGPVVDIIQGSAGTYYGIDLGFPEGYIYVIEDHIVPAPAALPPAAEMAADIIRSEEIWGAWRVFLDNVWSFDLATKHRYRGLCGLVKYGFRVLDFRNAVCGIIGNDGKRPDLQ